VTASPRTAIDRDRLVIRALVPSDADALASFTCGDDDLDDFLRTEALRIQELNVVRTFLGVYEGEVVGFASILTDAVVLETKERKGLALAFRDHPVVPALKIARLGVDSKAREKYRGLGEALVSFAVAKVLAVGVHVGCRLLTVDAYPQSVEFYERPGFVRNRAKEYRDKDHPSMRFDAFAPTLPPWVTG
jgi:GNAT superfamily N-acetyltransferase